MTEKKELVPGESPWQKGNDQPVIEPEIIEPEQEEAGLSFLWWAIPAAIVLLGGSIVAVIFLRKKKPAAEAISE